MALQSRSSSYSREEDIHLCHIYLDISQNPIIGINQSKDQFWSRVEDNYNNSKPCNIMQDRNKRSLQCRMQVILHAVGKLRGCIRQIENLNPSGASEQDIINRAKELLVQDKKYNKGFKFDHVWPLLKDIEKFAATVGGTSSQSDTQLPESPIPVSPGLSSFSINLSDDSASPSSERPIGVKKAKLKRKKDDQNLVVANEMKDETQKLVALLTNKSTDRQQNYEIEMKRLQVAEQREDNKILLKDLNSISNPQLREYFENEQERILLKRAQKQHLGSPNTSSSFGQYFQDIGGSGADLPDY